MDQTYIYGFCASIAFALGSVLFMQFSRSVSPLWMNAMKASVAVVAFGVAAVIQTGLPHAPPMGVLLSFLVSGLIGLNIGDFFLFRAFTSIGSARTLIIFSFEPFILGLFSYFLFGQTVNPTQFIAIFFIVGCVFVMSYEGFKKHGKWEFAGILSAFLGVFLDCVGVTLSRYGFDGDPQLTIFQGNFYRCVGALIGFFIVSQYVKIGLRKNFMGLRRASKITVVSACFIGTFVSLSFWLSAVSKGHLATLAAIGGGMPLMTTVFESIALRRWPSRYLYIALGLFFCGFYILNF